MLTPLGAMKLAIVEARKGLGHVSPNPPVGCVIIDKSGNFLAKGYHHKFGGDHAEIDALKQVRDTSLLEGAIVYVTLEPCAHIGKTPACAVTLSKLPIEKVIYGLIDPNPLVAGKGLEILRHAGIAVQPIKDLVGESATALSDELEELTEIFLLNHRNKKAFVSVKIASTLDGQIAHASGESQWLTGEEAREHAQYLRGIHDVVMIGAGTFRQDHPRLNVRHSRFPEKSNHVIIVNTSGDILDKIKNSVLYSCHDPSRVIVAVGENSKFAREMTKPDFHIWRLPEREGLVDMTGVFQKVYETGLSSVFVEGGARLVSHLIERGLAHRLYQFIAPQLLGIKSGRAFTESFVSSSFAERIVVKRPVWTPMGSDVLLSGRL